MSKKHFRWALQVAACLGISSSHAVCLNPFGCAPKTLDECRVDASNRPTDRGVNVALQDCQRIFVDEPRAKRDAETVLKTKTAWASLSESTVPLAEAKKRMGGDPVGMSNPGPCTHFPGVPDAVGPCVFYRWRADGQPHPLRSFQTRAQRVNGAFVPIEDALDLYFQLELDSKTGLVWSTVPEAVTMERLDWR